MQVWGKRLAFASMILFGLYGTAMAQAVGGVSPGSKDACQTDTHATQPFSIAAAQNTKIVTGAASKKIYVCHIFIFANAANSVAIIEGSGSACATSPVGVAGGAATANGFSLTANQGFVLGDGSNSVAVTATAANDLCLITSAATLLNGVVTTVTK